MPHLVPFLVIAVFVVVTPGVDTALVTTNALLHGRRAALLTALGVNAGIAVWTTASAFGLGALLHRSETLFTAVLVGAAYLVVLGAVFNLIGVAWLVGCAVFVSRVGDVLRRPRVRAAVERVTGCVLIAFGLRLATEPR